MSAGKIQGLTSEHLLAAVVAVAIGSLALAYGGNPPEATATIAIVAWWAVALGAVTGLLPRVRIEPTALIVLALLFSMTCLSALSILWASADGLAFTQTVQLISMLGIFGLCLAVSSPGSYRGWINGLALGLGFLVAIAVSSRYFTGLGDDTQLSAELGGVAGRLSWPLGYWNALAVVVAMSICLSTWLGANARTRIIRSLATGFISIGFLALYMTSSRGSTVAVAVGLLVLLFGGPRRIQLGVALLLGLVAGFILVKIASPMDALLAANQGPEATNQGHRLFEYSVLLLVLTSIFSYFIDRPLRNIRAPKLPLWLLIIPAVLALGALVAVKPMEQVDKFTAVPVASTDPTDTGNGTDHLLSSSGNGRWQFWTSAYDAFEDEPLHGIGAGGYVDYYAQNGSLPVGVRHTHSLPMQVLAELGIFGLLFLLGLTLIPLYTAIKRWLDGRARSRARALAGDTEANPDLEAWQSLPVFTSVFAVGAVTMSIDWAAEFPAITIPVLIAVAVMVGPATCSHPRTIGKRTGGLAIAAIAATVLLSAVAIWASFTSYTSATSLNSSRDAVDRLDLPAAAADAQNAIDATPWAAEPRVQLAGVQELAGQYEEALATVNEAIERSPDTGVYYVLRARIQLRLNMFQEAERSFQRARELDPKNSIAQQAAG